MDSAFQITLLPGDGIGPEIMSVAVDVLRTVGLQLGISFEFQTALVGGAAIDGTGHPIPSVTLNRCRESDGVLLAAIGVPNGIIYQPICDQNKDCSGCDWG
jgi:3-isopropylmalate dehydrogenase